MLELSSREPDGAESSDLSEPAHSAATYPQITQIEK